MKNIIHLKLLNITNSSYFNLLETMVQEHSGIFIPEHSGVILGFHTQRVI